MRRIPRTYHLLITLMVGLFVSLTSYAGSWDPDTNRKYRLLMNSSDTYPISQSDRDWATSLVTRLKNNGGNISYVRVLPRLEEHEVLLNDKHSTYSAYLFDEGKAVLVYSNTGSFLVDLERERVIALGVGGTSYFQHPSGNILVVVHTTGKNLRGVSVQGLWRNPNFDGKEVKWH